MCCSSLGRDAFRRGDFDAARRQMEASLQASRELGEPVRTAALEINFAGILFEEGRLAESEAINRRALSLFDALGRRVLAASARMNVAAVLIWAGRWAESLALSRRAQGELEALDVWGAADAAIHLQAATLTETGMLDEADRVGRELDRRLDGRPQAILGGIVARDRGRAARWRGDTEEALRQWSRSGRIAEEAGARDEQARTWLEEATVRAIRGEVEAARGLRERISETAQECGGADLAVRGRFLDALLLRLEDRGRPALDEAVRLLETAAEEAAVRSLRPWTWKCHAARVGLLGALGRRGESVTPLRLAEEALRELLEAIGSPALQESYVRLPDPRFFLHWLETETPEEGDLPASARSDLEVFFR